MSGIDVRGVQDRIANLTDATIFARKTVNTTEQGKLTTCLYKSGTGTNGTTIVHAKD